MLKRGPWFVDGHMETGKVVFPSLQSLMGFWPSIETLEGDVREAEEVFLSFASVWATYGALPEVRGLECLFTVIGVMFLF